MKMPESVLVTGATGYVGGRLVPVLEAASVRLRCLARRPAELEAAEVARAAAQTAVDSLEDDVRRAGGLPGWVR